MCFPGNDTGFPGLASDPTRPGPTPTSEPNFHILSPVRPPFGPTSHWRVLSRRVGRFHILWRENHIARIKGEGVNQVHQVRCGILEIWVCVTGSTRCVRRIPLKVSSGSDPTYESLDPVSKVVNWSQHPLQDPIDKGRSVFKQSPGIIGIEVYVQWAILCRRWRHTDLFWLFGKSYTWHRLRELR